MHFEKIVPNIFYKNITDGLRLFVDCLGFSISHDEIKSAQPFCVLERDGLRIKLVENAGLAAEHYPEFRLVTRNIEEVYQKIADSHPNLLHPNLKKITLRPRGGEGVWDKGYASRGDYTGVVRKKSDSPTRSLQQISTNARNKAGIREKLGIHSLRHSFATHLLDTCTDIRYIKDLLRHFNIKTTERYLHVSKKQLLNIVSPFDDLWKKSNLDW